jgi:hypothetical protein
MRHIANKKSPAPQRFRLSTPVVFSTLLLVLSLISSAFAQKSKQEIFSSADEASHALFLAVQGDNDQGLIHILGGRKELVSSDDAVADKSERQQFAHKYDEMHGLVREPDGTTLLFVGAENWPFPIPLVSKAGKWYFDADAGIAEILFRRVGENEATAIETCLALVQAKKQPEVKAVEDDPATRYAQTLVAAHDPGKYVPVNKDESSDPFQGYYFRMLTEPSGSGAGAKTNSSDPAAATRYAFIAYPAEYRSPGVMTFIVTQDDAVFERDLGPNTAELAKRITFAPPQDLASGSVELTLDLHLSLGPPTNGRSKVTTSAFVQDAILGAGGRDRRFGRDCTRVAGRKMSQPWSDRRVCWDTPGIQHRNGRRGRPRRRRMPHHCFFDSK